MGLRVAVVGAGAVGTRAARQLVSSPQVDTVVLRDPDDARLDLVADSLGPAAVADRDRGTPLPEADVVVVASPAGTQAPMAEAALRRGQPVVTTSDALADVRALLALDLEARERGVSVAVGATFAPGLTDVLAAHAAARFDVVTEVHVASSSAGGPACARQRLRALGRRSVDWRDGAWVERPGGSGRALCWFPDPVGALDCYRAERADPFLLAPAFPEVERVTARSAASRRDRVIARLPVSWPAPAEGDLGAVRVEVRGRRSASRDVVVYGVMDRPAVAAGAVAAVTALALAGGEARRVGAAGLAELLDPLPVLRALRERGVRAAVFEGDGSGAPA